MENSLFNYYNLFYKFIFTKNIKIYRVYNIRKNFIKINNKIYKIFNDFEEFYKIFNNSIVLINIFSFQTYL